jgi:ribosomal protein S18 acetylase RimI-like enzyme
MSITGLLPRRLSGLVARSRHIGLGAAVLYTVRPYLSALGVILSPFYVFKEVIEPDHRIEPVQLPDGFEISVFGQEEIAVIATHPERAKYVGEGYVLNNFRRGDTCLGVKHNGTIAGFSWFSLTALDSNWYSAPLKANEAYMYDAYVFEGFRRKNLALALRHRSYAMLQEQRRNVCYSLTACSNIASVSFKKRLGAQKILLGLSVLLFRTYQKTFILKRWPDASAGRS